MESKIRSHGHTFIKDDDKAIWVPLEGGAHISTKKVSVKFRIVNLGFCLILVMLGLGYNAYFKPAVWMYNGTKYVEYKFGLWANYTCVYSEYDLLESPASECLPTEAAREQYGYWPKDFR